MIFLNIYGVTTHVDEITHEKITQLARANGLTLKKLTAELLIWAGSVGTDEIVRAGVRIPTWTEVAQRDLPTK